MSTRSHKISIAMKQFWADPEFRAERIAAQKRGHLISALNEVERAEYDAFKKAGYTRAEALTAIGREDLLNRSAPK